MTMKLRFYIRNVWGKETRYPVDEEIKNALLAFNGQVTLTDADLRGFSYLGYEPEVVMDPAHLTKQL